MSKLAKPMLLSLIFTALLLFVLAPDSVANSAEPPSIVIIAPYAPEDLKISVGTGDIFTEGNKRVQSFESQFSIYSYELTDSDTYTVRISSGKGTYELTLDKPLKKYNNLFTLDYNNRTLTPGKSLGRSFTVVSLRILLTLIIEGVIFFLFGYRKRKSWIVFLITNLLTQGYLNISLDGYMPTNGYVVFSLFLFEIFIFFIELIVFMILLNEHKRLRTFLYVLTANFVSLIAGGYIITLLPV